MKKIILTFIATLLAGLGTATAQNVAKIGTTEYATLEAAFAAAQDGETITLLSNCGGNGIKAPRGKFANGLTIDFAGFTYTVDGELVGSTGTETQGFQLLKDNTITFKNGTIYSEKALFLIQNYSNLTLKGMTLTMNNASYSSAYTLSNNNGNIVIDGTTINANPAGIFAFDVCRYASYPSVSVTVKGNSVINGNVEISASANNAKDGFGLSLESGTLNGQIIVDASAATAMENTPDKVSVTKSSSFKAIVPGYTWDANGKIVAAPVVAQIGTLGYSSLEEAFAVVKNGQTIKLVADITLTDNITSPLVSGQFTLQFNGKTVTKGSYSIQLHKGVTVLTDGVFGNGEDVSTAIFSAADEGNTIVRMSVKVGDTNINAYKAVAPVADKVDYIDIDKNGNETASKANNVIDLAQLSGIVVAANDQYYYASENATIDGLVFLANNTSHLILTDNVTLTMNSAKGNNSIKGNLIVYGQKGQTGNLVFNGSSDLSVQMLTYTQKGGNVKSAENKSAALDAKTIVVNAGTLDIYTNSGSHPAIGRIGTDVSESTVTINGGVVTAKGMGANNTAIKAGDIYITGGQTTAEAGVGMYATNASTTTLSLKTIEDFILSDSYSGTVKIAEGKTLYDQDDNYKPYTGTLEATDLNAIKGHHLVLASVLIFDKANDEEGYGDDKQVIAEKKNLAEAIAAIEDGQFIHMTISETLTEDINVPLTDEGQSFSLKFGNADITSDGGHIILPFKVSVNTDKQTDIFDVPEDLKLTHAIKETQNEDGTYTYTYTTVKAVAYNQQTEVRYATLQGAVDAAEAGQTIVLMEAIQDEENVLTETVTIDKALTIEGQNLTITAACEKDYSWDPDNVKPAILVKGNGDVTLNKVKIDVSYTNVDQIGYTDGGIAIQAAEGYSGKLTLDYCDIKTSNRGVDVQDVATGFELIVKNGTISGQRGGDDPITDENVKEKYINTFDRDPYQSSRGINLSNGEVACNVKVENMLIQGLAYAINISAYVEDVQAPAYSSYVTLDVKDCSLYGRGGVNVWGTHNTVTLDNVTINGINNQTEGDTETFACIVENELAQYNDYYIKGTKVSAAILAKTEYQTDADGELILDDDGQPIPVEGTNATQKFLDLRGKDATVKITGDSGFAVDAADKDRTGFMNNEQIINLINPEINNRVYFDAPSKAYFSYYFESMPLMTDGDDKQFRLGISDETDETNLYPVIAIYPKVMLTMSKETGEVDDEDMPVYEMNYYYYETLESAFASEFFADQAQLNLLDNVELNDDITVNLKRGENFTLTADDYTLDANGHNIILPTLVFAFTDIVNEENAPLYKVQDEDLTALLGTPEEEGYYVPANVYWAADVTDISGQYWLFDELFTKTNEDIAIWPDSYTRLEREITLERNLKFPTEVGEGGIEEIEPVDGGARRMVDGDVVDRDYWIDFNDFDLLPGDDYSIILKLGNYVYTTKTTDIFTSGEAGYRVIYDVLADTDEGEIEKTNEKDQKVTFKYKYYLIKDGIVVTVDPATYCGDRLTPTFVVKKKVVVDDEETWVELRGITKDEYDERVANTPEGEEVNLTGIDFYWHLVPPADPDDDKTYIDAKTYSNALVIEGITFAGTEKADFVILPRDIKDVTVDGNVQPYTAGGYDAAAIEALISAVYNCTTHTTTTGEGDDAVTTNNSVNLVVDKDYKITVEDGPEVVENVGKYIDPKTYKQVITLTAVEGGNYTGTLKVDFIIGGEDDIALAEILAETIYNGAAQLPKTKTAEDAEDATVIVHNVKGVELYGVTFEEGTTITDDQLKKADDEYYDFFMTYKKVANVEYDYPTTANNEYTNADTYKMAVTITGIGNYHGHKTVDYVIKPKDIADCTVDGLVMNYTGSEISTEDIIDNITVTDPAIVTVVADEEQAKELMRLLGNVDYEYTVEVSDNFTYKEVQVYPNAITITGLHNYTGTLNLNFQIVPADAIDISTCLVVSKAVYTSTVQEPSYETIQLTDRNGNIVDKKYYTITVNGTATGDNVEYINAKTYSNAMTISAITPEGQNPKYYGSFNADYVIKQRDLADSEMGNDKGYVVLEAYAGADATTTNPETFPLQWTGNALVPVINGADANNINLLLQYQNAVKDNDEPDGTYELVAVDYTYTIEPSPMKDPGLYKIIFTGRGNFTGMREVNVMVLKDINELADNIKMPYQIIPDNLALTPSQMKGIEVKDGNKVLVENEEYTLVIKGGNDEIFDETTPIYVKGKYYAYFYGKEPYYTGKYVDDFRAFFEYIGWDTNPVAGTGTNIYCNPTSKEKKKPHGNIIASSGLHYDDNYPKPETPVSVRITDVSDSLNLKAEITYIDNINEGTVTACDPTKEIVKVNPKFQIVAGYDNGDARKFIFNIVGVQDNAFKNLPRIHCLDLTQIEGYTPDNLTRSEDGPFNYYPVQSLVYFDGTRGGKVAGTNYIYKKGENDFRCEELKIYDDLAGDQQDIRQNEGTYAWEFKNIYEFTADKVTNTRKFNKDQHYTICLPYQLQMTDDLKAYSLDASSSQILGFKEVDATELAQFTPYVLIPSKAGNLLNNANTTTVYTTDVTPASVTAGNATMTGSNIYMAGADAAGKYIMQGKDPNHNEWRVIGAENGYGDGVAEHGPCILPMRAYISINGGSREVLMAKYMDKIDSMPVEIETNELEGAEVYDLQGRKVDTTRTTLRKGVYVVNGQKRMIK